MIASELRIGNWVQNGPFIGRVSNVGDTAFLDFKGCEPFNNGNSIKFHEAYFDEDEFRPIPLTEEWLIKFDYLAEVGTYRFSIAGKFPELFIDTENKKCWLEANTDMILLDYPGTVHRFQNLHHAIYNEELTIKE